MQKKSFFKRLMGSMAARLFIILVVLVIATMVLSSGVLDGEPASALFKKGFMSVNNLRQIFFNLVIQCVMMCGISCILIGGNIDLSVAGQATLSTMIFAWLCSKTPLPWPVAVIIVLVIAACFGLVNTFLVTKLKFPAFIATIGMASVYKGLCSVITSGYNIQINRVGFTNLAKGSLFGIFPATFIFAVVLMVICQFVLSKTRFGRSVFMAGGNPGASRLAGININKTTCILFVINSIMAAIGGLLWTSQMKLASPTSIITDAPDMTVISAAILGGVAFTGGSGNLAGPFIALLLLNVLDNMLTVIGVQSYWNIVAQGLLLAVALIFDYVSAERRRKALLAA